MKRYALFQLIFFGMNGDLFRRGVRRLCGRHRAIAGIDPNKRPTVGPEPESNTVVLAS